MALKLTCDVFGTAKGVKPYMVLLVELDPGETGAETAFEIAKALTGDRADPKKVLDNARLGGVLTAYADLCPRALDRLKAKIETGTTPPVKRDGMEALRREQEALANKRKKTDDVPGAEALAK